MGKTECFYSHKPQILVASDQEAQIKEIVEYLQPYGYHVLIARTLLAAIELVKKRTVDAVLADVGLPPLSGYELCRTLKSDSKTKDVPIILITHSYLDTEAKARGLDVGADDLLYEPLHDIELRARLRASIRRQFELQQVRRQARRLDYLVRKRTKELEEITNALVAALEKASTLNDTDTGKHIHRVCIYCELLGEALNLETTFVLKLKRYASLHDIGKLGLPDSILKKQGKLTLAEYEEMKKHTIWGYELLTDIKADIMAANIALCHHEKFNGTGYPHAKKGSAIPLEARIVALADVYDALTTRRCYKKPVGPNKAAIIIEAEAGKHFDPSVVRAFTMVRKEFEDVLKQFGD